MSGGLHSHAAIVAREFRVPCVVRTEWATLACATASSSRSTGRTEP
ncbi:PEP-utilizing enzyme [Mycolicibacterium elephantis]